MKTKRNVGPLDKRKKMTRCQPCARRRIKCQGGSPCEYCIRTKKLCQPQVVSVNEVKFVTCTSPQETLRVDELPLQINEHADIIYLGYFDHFMQNCRFTQEFVNLGPDLLPLIQTCPPLREATIAIGALEASRRAARSPLSGRQSLQNVAFGSYGKSIQKLQNWLQSLDAIDCQGVLWCTLLLGLFELMTEMSGDQWAKHMLYGTSRILQSHGAINRLGPLGERFFGAFRTLEANRAIIYGEDTFLSHEPWLRHQGYLAATLTSPLETILDLVIQISSFSKRFFDQIESIPEILRQNHPAISALAKEGCRFQQRLQDWHEQTVPYVVSSDPYFRLALANYHALDLFICKNYTFYAIWEGEVIPLLTSSEIDMHVNAVLTQSDAILGYSNVPGILLLFPLRMAGANTKEPLQSEEILRLLDRISQKGFVVSERIKIDLQELWEYESFENGGIQSLTHLS